MLKTAIWIVIVGALFGWAWHKGYLLRLSNYIQETREELRKCTWPTTEELKGSTAVVMVAMALLGAYIVGIDVGLLMFVKLVTSL